MKSIDLIRWALQVADETTMQLVDTVQDSSSAQAAHCDSAHLTWVLGHLCLVEATTPYVLFGDENPVESWRPLFGPGTSPQTGASAYPTLEEVLTAYRSIRARTLQLLEQVGEEGLDRRPLTTPPGFENWVHTFGEAFLLIAQHQMVHYGQLAEPQRMACATR